MQTEKSEILSLTSDNPPALDDPKGTVVDPAKPPVETTDPKPVVKTSDVTATEKPEFTDPNMQARFTQKMTEFKQKEKELEAFKGKADAFEFLAKDPRFVKFYNEVFKQPAKPAEFQVPEITDDDFYAATTSREAMQQLLDKQITARIQFLTENKINPQLQDIQQKFEQREQQIKSQEIINQISEFADSENEEGVKLYPDFWELDKENLIEPHLKTLAYIPEKVLPLADKLKIAYQLAKFPLMGKKAVAEAHDIVAAKKRAVGEKGSGPVNTSPKQMSTREFYEKKAAELGIS